MLGLETVRFCIKVGQRRRQKDLEVSVAAQFESDMELCDNNSYITDGAPMYLIASQ